MSKTDILRLPEYLGHIVQAIDRVHRYVADRPLNFAFEMRNALAHGYFKIDFGVVWTTIHADLPGLRSQVAALITP